MFIFSCTKERKMTFHSVCLKEINSCKSDFPNTCAWEQQEWYNNINKHKMVLFYKIWKKYNEFQLTNKLNWLQQLKNEKSYTYPPRHILQAADLSWVISNLSWVISNFSWVISNLSCVISNLSCVTSNLSCVISNLSCVISNLSYVMCCTRRIFHATEKRSYSRFDYTASRVSFVNFSQRTLSYHRYKRDIGMFCTSSMAKSLGNKKS